MGDHDRVSGPRLEHVILAGEIAGGRPGEVERHREADDAAGVGAEAADLDAALQRAAIEAAVDGEARGESDPGPVEECVGAAIELQHADERVGESLQRAILANGRLAGRKIKR